MNKYLISLLLAIFASQAPAAQAQKWGAPLSEVTSCVKKASSAFGVSEVVIWTLLDVESGTLGKVSMNTNKTVDIGPMQINSIHLPRLAKMGITEHQLKNTLCTNINVGAWIYASEYASTRDVAKAIARYHSRTPKFQSRYLGLAINALNRRIAQQNPNNGQVAMPVNKPLGTMQTIGAPR